MNDTPLISVTLPNYNHGRFLRQAIQSVLVQTYPHFEILLTDDGSTDDSRAIAEEFVREDPRIKPFYFEQNRGAMPAHANTWSRVHGSLVYQYSSDDYLADPDFFRLGVEALTQHPHAAGFYGVAGIYAAETGLCTGQMGQATKVGYIGPREFLQEFLTQDTFVPGISSLWRKSLIDALGGYDVELGPQADYFINHALPCLSGVVFAKRMVAAARCFAAKTSFSGNTKMEDDLRRLALVATKLRRLTAHCGPLESEWTSWRRHQAKHILFKYRTELAQAGGLAAMTKTFISTPKATAVC